MKIRYKLIIKGIAILGIVGLLTSCGSSSNPAPADDGGGVSTGLTIPANAVTITDANAGFVASSALGSMRNIDIVLAFDDIVSAPVATGVEESRIIPCNSLFLGEGTGGSIIEIEDSTQNPPGFFSFSGTLDFMDCQLLPGFTVDGIISFEGTEDEIDGDLHVTASSSGLTFTFDTMIGVLAFEDDIFPDPIEPIIITLQFNYEETANEISGVFSKLYDYSVTIIPEGGFLVTTTEPFEGNFNEPPGIALSGQIIIEGANNTRLLVTLINDTEANVELDDGNGDFMPHSTIFLFLMGPGDVFN